MLKKREDGRNTNGGDNRGRDGGGRQTAEEQQGAARAGSSVSRDREADEKLKTRHCRPWSLEKLLGAAMP